MYGTPRMDQEQKTPAQWERDFNHNLADNRVNGKASSIPGYKEDKTQSYLIRLKGIKGITLPKDVKVHAEIDLTAELHMSFFYRDMKATGAQEKTFFFGRTARSKKFQLEQENKKNTYGTREKNEKNEEFVEYLYFHSCLGKTMSEIKNRKDDAPEVFLVFELVVTATDTKGRGDQKTQVFSGGYGTTEIFKVRGQ